MSKIFYKLGKMAGPSVRKAKWVWQTATDSQAKAAKAEYEVGRDMAYDVRQRLHLDPDPQTAQILNEIGSQIASCVANKHRSFKFESFKGPVPQAFCLPGGSHGLPLLVICLLLALAKLGSSFLRVPIHRSRNWKLIRQVFV